MAAKLGVVSGNTVADLEALDIRCHIYRGLSVCPSGVALQWPSLTNNNANRLVSGDEREFGDKLALVNVKISAADTASLGK